jgi:hypothetical protein
MSATFETKDGERRVRVVSVDGRQEFIVEKRNGLLSQRSRGSAKGWHVVTETASVEVVSMHVNFSQLIEVGA